MKLIKNGTIVNADRQWKADVLISGSKIIKIEPEIEHSDAEIIDATDCYVFPGFIDPHTHVEMGEGILATADTFETATKAAVINGTTTIIDYITQDKQQTLKDAYKAWLKKAENKSSCNYRFHMGISDWNEDVRAEIKEMPNLGVTSFKLYMAYKNLIVNDAQILECLQEIKTIDGLLGVHCENGTLIDELKQQAHDNHHLDPTAHPATRPPSTEAEAINRLAYISKIANHPVMVVHLSSKEGLEEVLYARKHGIHVYAETCPHYMLLDDSKYALPNFEGAKYVMSPPLRKVSDNKTIIDALVNGDIDTIATDHCPFNFKGQKELGKDDFSLIPNGAPGIEERPLIVYTLLVKEKLISLEKMVELLSTNAAKLYGMYPRKGVIQEGSDADIVIFNPNHKKVISAQNQLQNVDYSLYEGIEVAGQAKYVFVNGELVVSNNRIIQENKGTYAF